MFCAKAMIILLEWHLSGTGLVDLFEYVMLSCRILKDEAGYSSERDGVGELMIGFLAFCSHYCFAVYRKTSQLQEGCFRLCWAEVVTQPRYDTMSNTARMARPFGQPFSVFTPAKRPPSRMCHTTCSSHSSASLPHVDAAQELAERSTSSTVVW